eukprot:TRINITY_DN3398_c0_g1_i1.p1 TRINITY_DN3398_c0_g1~~TRINITY_DN3398_c0_g1_i1.p1  ORF type:complete len:311 (-),score=88.21 TRINITY_DN3398_c0_g1_i1:32-931(-)
MFLKARPFSSSVFTNKPKTFRQQVPFAPRAFFCSPSSASSTEVKQQILSQGLKHVSKVGWSKEALAEASKELGYSVSLHGLFPNGGLDLIHYFLDQINEKFVSQVSEEKTKDEIEQKNLTEKLNFLVRLRLQFYAPYISSWPSALAELAAPTNLPDSTIRLLKLMDEIWYHAGDTSTDVDWYSKRLALAGVYGATELYMLTDQSDQFSDTWKFLERRIDNMKDLDQTRSQVFDYLTMAATVVGSFLPNLHTAQTQNQSQNQENHTQTQSDSHHNQNTSHEQTNDKPLEVEVVQEGQAPK